MLWGSGRGPDIVDVWPVGLEVVGGEDNLILQGEEDNLILQGEEAKASLCNGRRKFEKGSHSHCGRGETATARWYALWRTTAGRFYASVSR